MVTITGEYEGELHCTAVHGPSGKQLVTDAPKDNQGRGEAFSPTDLAATALATCMCTMLGILARKHNVDLRGLRYEVTKEMAKDPPRRIGRLVVQLWLPVRRDVFPDGLVEKTAESCPVHLSLHPSIEKVVTYHFAE